MLLLTCKADDMILLCFSIFFIAFEPLVVTSTSTLPPECPENLCGRNGTYKNCPNPCQGTCSNPAGSKICPRICLKDGCECFPGYVLHNGRCILLKDCPGTENRCGRNGTYKSCPNPCQATCSNPAGSKICPMICLQGCECYPGYVLYNGSCILLKDCPDHLRCNDDPNSVWKSCPSACPRTCEYPAGPGMCNKMCLHEGCECKDGYYQNDQGKCVKLQDCPGAKKCSATESFVFCYVKCPSEYCPDTDSQAMIACSPPFPCKSGCGCIAGHLRRRSDGKCIPASQCPPIKCKRPNEILNKSPPPCLNERCSDIGNPPVPCDWFPTPSPKCVCKPGFCRNSLDECVPNPPKCDIPLECRPTCAVPNPPGCDYCPSDTNQHGCSCRQGFVLSKIGGWCVEIEKCPTNISCNGDPNAVIKQNPLPCPSTCDRPNAFHCRKKSEPLGCVCRPGYILSEANGKCILPDDCSCGNPCGRNRTFVPCKYDSAYFYCPTDYESVVDHIPPPFLDCLSGCVCKKHYKMLSRDNPKCIKSVDCPPKCDIPLKCRPTCAVPNPPGCEYYPSDTNKHGCSCRQGFVLSEIGGICVEIEKCPTNISCNGDPNAVIKQNPLPCPSTCYQPNAFHCKKMSEPLGCVCRPGYIISEANGKCILPDDCSCGNPCGRNGTFVPCKFDSADSYCPTDNKSVEDHIPPPSLDCLSGCVCKKHYKKLSRDNPKCIKSKDCPPNIGICDD